jgi:trk system potassium uptake protein TrkH
MARIAATAETVRSAARRRNMGAQASELSYAVRPWVLAVYIGQLCLVAAALTLPPLLFAVFEADLDVCLRYAVVIAVFGAPVLFLKRLREPKRIQTNEAMVIAAIIFVLVPAATTWPLMGAGLSFTDALFEAVSGVTTTGLTTLDTVADKPAHFLFARSWMQWYGGLGFVVLSLALVVRAGSATKELSVVENREEDLVGGTKTYARRVFRIYALMTLVAGIAVVLTGVSPFEGLLYALAAVSTGGFSPLDESLAPLAGSFAPAVVLLACVAGAVPLAFYYQVRRPGWRKTFGFLQTVALAIFIGVAATILSLWFAWRGNAPAWWHAPLLIFSAQSTAGFSTVDPANLDAASKLLLMIAMFTGGGAGSTAGGIKLIRTLIIGKLLMLLLFRTSLTPHAVARKQLHGRTLDGGECQEAMLVVLLFLGVIVFSWSAFLLGGYDPIDSLFEVVSAVGTVGLSTGITGPDLPGVLKAVLCVDMLLGRLEILAWLVLIYPRTWIGRRL